MKTMVAIDEEKAPRATQQRGNRVKRNAARPAGDYIQYDREYKRGWPDRMPDVIQPQKQRHIEQSHDR